MAYIICFIAKVVIGSFAIANYSMCKNAKTTELRLFCAILSSFATVACMGMTIWQMTGK